MSNSPFPEISDEALQIGFRKATEFRNLLILASVVLAIVSLLFGLDFLLGSLLGSAIIGLNFHWTVRFVLNMLEERKLRPLYLLIYGAKFIVSMMVLYVAIVQLDISAVGIMLGLSNILLAATAYALIQRPRSSDSSDVLS
ncbi:MAG: ATP synthase subunit I [SAR324 cluster bacterium]|nr:ATP synthase subunit I [SAR324 cluster bacterium]